MRAAVCDLARILRVPDWAFVTANVTMRFKWRPFVKVVNKVRLAEHPPKSKTLPTKTAALLIARSISEDRKSTRLNFSHSQQSRMPSSA